MYKYKQYFKQYFSLHTGSLRLGSKDLYLGLFLKTIIVTRYTDIYSRFQ